MPLGAIQSKVDGEESVIIQFKICCPQLDEGTCVYVIGSSLKLGQWKVQNGVKLNYSGDSFWQADCVMGKDDFPLKYKYCKYRKGGALSLEHGANRELSLDFTNSSQPKYVILSDGMMR